MSFENPGAKKHRKDVIIVWPQKPLESDAIAEMRVPVYDRKTRRLIGNYRLDELVRKF